MTTYTPLTQAQREALVEQHVTLQHLARRFTAPKSGQRGYADMLVSAAQTMRAILDQDTRARKAVEG